MNCRQYLILSIVVLGVVWQKAEAQPGIFATTSDYQTGSIAYLPPGSLKPQVDLLVIHADAVVRYYAGRVYVINRLGQDNILVLDPQAPSVPLLQFSVGNGTNPQDLEFAGPEKAYVSRYESASLLIVDPRRGTSLGEIDLSAFADEDGLPEMGEMAILDSRLYVACQRLDRQGSWGPVAGSLLVAIDMATDSVVDLDPESEGVQGIELAADNPNTLIPLGGKIVVAGTAFFGDRLGGIEIVDPISRTSSGLLISEQALGGDLTALAMVSSTHGYAVVSDENFVNSVRSVDLSRGLVGPPLAGHSGGYTPSLVVDGQRLIVADRGTFADPNAAGLLIYEAATGNKLAGPIGVGLPPSSLAVLAEVEIYTAVEEGPSQLLPQQARLGAAYPNPFNARVNLPFAVTGGPVRLAIFDLLGRPIRVLAQGWLEPGEQVTSWDGCDEAGRKVGSGTYVVELQTPEQRSARKIVLLK